MTADGVFERERERERERGRVKRVRVRDMCEERENKKVFFGILIHTFLNLE